MVLRHLFRLKKKGVGRDRPAAQSDSLQPLLIGLLDDQLSDDDHRQLAGLLRNDRAARTYYLQYMLTDALLRAEFGGEDRRGLGTSAHQAANSRPWAVNANEGTWYTGPTSAAVDRADWATDIRPEIGSQNVDVSDPVALCDRSFTSNGRPLSAACRAGLFHLRLAGGVSGGNRDFRDRPSGRSRGASVPS